LKCFSNHIQWLSGVERVIVFTPSLDNFIDPIAVAAIPAFLNLPVGDLGDFAAFGDPAPNI
jgi:hypothetical protein